MVVESQILVPEIQFIILLIISVIVAIAVKYVNLPYTIALLIVGMLVGLTGIEEIELSKGLIFFIFLPALLFEGSIHIDLNKLRDNAKIITILAFIGLTASVFIVGIIINEFTGIPLLPAVLFGAMIMPTDPVSVLALFKKLGVPKKLTTIVEGESLFNDGVGVVLFSVILALVSGEAEFNLVGTLINFSYVILGGLGIGLVSGYFAYGILKQLDDHLIEILITGILAYGTFIVAELIHASGVMGVVVAGLFIGNRGTEFAMSPKTRITILSSWELVVFIINSVIFLLMGIRIPVGLLLDNLQLVLIAICAVVFARAFCAYSLIGLFNIKSRKKISLGWQHVINWGGLHGSIPIALVLGLPVIEYGNELSIMVFGVVVFSLIFQGLTIEPLVKKLKIITSSPQEVEYEKIIAKKISIQKASDTLKELYRKKEIPSGLYSEFKEVYEKEAEYLKRLASEKLEMESVLLDKQRMIAKNKILTAQKSSVLESMRRGIISDEVAVELISELDSEIDALSE